MFKNNTFDGVICLGGTLSHLVDKKTREKAVSELKRVAKRGAPIFISVIGRLAVLIAALTKFPNEIEIKEAFENPRDSGDYFGGYGFCPCHIFLLEELADLLKKKKLKILEMAGLEGLSTHHQKETNRLFKKYQKAWKIWWQTHLKTCAHPSIVGISEHILVIAKK